MLTQNYADIWNQRGPTPSANRTAAMSSSRVDAMSLARVGLCDLGSFLLDQRGAMRVGYRREAVRNGITWCFRTPPGAETSQGERNV